MGICSDGKTTTMNDFKSEFRPPDDELIGFILTLASSIKEMSISNHLSEEDKTNLSLAERNLKLLLAMTMSGYALYIGESQHADDLALLVHDLRTSLKNVSPLDELATDFSALSRYTEWRTELTDETVPLFDGF